MTMNALPDDSRAISGLFDLTGRTACVVGGGGYLGGPVCEALARHGAHVVVADGRLPAATEVVRRLDALGLSAEAVSLDIADEAAVAALVDRIVRQRGHLDVAINATAFSTGKPMEEMTLSDWQSGTRVTLGGAFVLGREAGRVMVRQGRGSIIQFGSMYGLVSPDFRVYGDRFAPNPADYGAAKAGILQLVRYQAVKWARDGVRVNAVVPGPFPNPAGMGTDREFVDRLADRVPMGRVGRAEEIAGAVLFLAADASSYVSGTSIVVDGGWTAW